MTTTVNGPPSVVVMTNLGRRPMVLIALTPTISGTVSVVLSFIRLVNAPRTVMTLPSLWIKEKFRTLVLTLVINKLLWLPLANAGTSKADLGKPSFPRGPTSTFPVPVAPFIRMMMFRDPRLIIWFLRMLLLKTIGSLIPSLLKRPRSLSNITVGQRPRLPKEVLVARKNKLLIPRCGPLPLSSMVLIWTPGFVTLKQTW